MEAAATPGAPVDTRRSKAGKHRGKTEEFVKNDRRNSSNQKNRGRPKKGGAGGKHTWGVAGVADMYDADTALDRGDINYDSDENDEYVLLSRYDRESSKAERVGVPLASAGRLGMTGGAGGDAGAGDAADVRTGPRLNLSGFKKKLVPVIAEFFDSEDVDEVARAVLDLQSPFFHYEVVKRTVTMSMDKNDRERELASRLISSLYPKVLPMAQVGKGFERLFELADDLELDNPEAHKMLAQFLGRAVVDEVLPPSFLSDPMVEDLGGDIVKEAKVLLSIRHGSARLEKVWGPAAGATKELKQAVRMLVKEFFLSGDAAEAARCIRELNVPHFHHETIKRTIVVALDRDAATQDKASELIKYLQSQGVVSQNQMSIGFGRVKDELADISLDQPQAPTMFAALVAAAKANGCLDAEWDGHSPSPAADAPAAAPAADADAPADASA